MKFSLKTVLIAASITLALSACGKKQETAADSEADRQLLQSARDLAINLAKNNPRHDAQYYLDRMGELMNSCKRGGEIDLTCFKNGLDRLQRE